MKNFLLIILAAMLIHSCNNEEDTAWKKLIATNDFKAIENFIVQNPDTESLIEGIELIVKLKKQKDDTTQVPTYPNYYGRNVIRIIINKNDELEIIGETFNGKANSEIVRQISKDYFINSENHSDLPESKLTDVNNNDIVISKGHVYLVIDRTAKIDTIRKVVKILSNTLSNYKQYLKETFVTIKSEKLVKEINEDLDSLLENRIWIFDIIQHEETLPNNKVEDKN